MSGYAGKKIGILIEDHFEELEIWYYKYRFPEEGGRCSFSNSPPELVRGRRVVVNNNLIGDVRNMGAIYVDKEVVVDGDLVTARSSDRCNIFVRTIIDCWIKNN